MNRDLTLLGIALSLQLGAATGFAGDVVINEIMYRPPVETNHEEFIELYNRSTHVVDLTGWRFSQGVHFTFTNSTVLPAGAYLVVAQDLSAFKARHPSVTNCLGNWDGQLGNNAETVELDDALGLPQDSVAYANDGDWAVRIKDQPDLNHRGWVWSSPADGGGASLELMNPALTGKSGQNWAASLADGGTPGQTNSVRSGNIAPMLLDVHHTPLVPKSTESVVVTARVLDESSNGIVATLYYRLDGTPGFTAVTLVDDGAHGDGAGADGVFGGLIPPQTNRAIVEFYVSVRDGGNNARTWPAPAMVDNVAIQAANLLYQVDDSAAYSGDQPFYRLVLKAADLAELQQINQDATNAQSRAQMNGTFISVDGISSELRYNVGVRNRSRDSAALLPQGYELGFQDAQTWKGVKGVRLNTQFAPAQLAGSAIFRRAGLVAAETRPVQVRVNGINYVAAGMPATGGTPTLGFFVHAEGWDTDLVTRHFPADAAGNLYGGFDAGQVLGGGANLAYLGNQADAYRTNQHYFKHSNTSLDDWTDLVGLTYALNEVPDSNYAAAVSAVVNVDQWLDYFSLQVLLDNKSPSLANGYGHNYYLYRGGLDTRFQLLPYDLDNILNAGATAGATNDPVFTATAIPALDKFLKWPDFAPRYYGRLKRHIETTCDPAQLNPLLDQNLGGVVPPATLEAVKSFAAQRADYVRSQIPLALTVATSATVSNGYPRVTNATITLFGAADAIRTRSVLVGNSTSIWSAWEGRWTNTFGGLNPGINRLLIRSLGTNGIEFARVNFDVWYDDSSIQSAGGLIAVSTNWTAAGGPYQVTSSLTVASNVTLTIEPGTTIYLNSGANLNVTNGGRLLAEGTATAPIRFTRLPGLATSWGGINIYGSVGSPESRIAYAHLEYNGAIAIHSFAGTVFCGHLTFGTPAVQYMWFDNSSEIVSDCVFPTPTGVFEPIDGVNGIKTGGHALFLRNFFGPPHNYEDVIDFTGGNRPGTTNGPLVHFIGNVLMGSQDDGLDLDGTDAWVEGNIFLHFHRNGNTPDSSSAVSGGQNQSGTVNTSEITIVNNLFFDCDNACDAKEGNFYTFLNNTVVHTTKTGGIDFDSGVLCVRDTTPAPTVFARGYYAEANLIWDAEKLVRNYDSNQTTVTLTNNLLPMAWTGPGLGNVIADPRLKHLPQVAETQFQNWQDAQVMWDWFSLQADSPARGLGIGGRDLGAVVPPGPFVLGAPSGVTYSNSATLRVAFNYTGNGIPAAGFPLGSGYTQYRWRLDGSGPWSTETPISNPIVLTSLANGPHYVEVSGLDDAYLYRDDTLLGGSAVTAVSPVWIVDTNRSRILINEVLARNVSAVLHGTNYPDLIELYNDGPTNRDLSGLGLTDDATNKFKFSFPAGTTLGAGQYLVVYADKDATSGGLHLGYALKQSGSGIYLYDAAARGAGLLDSIQFGLQVADLSIGRLADGSWTLTKPTFGAANVAQPLGDGHGLKINEWLAHGQSLFANDFIELFNPGALPVALGGLFLSDNPVNLAQNPRQLAALRAIAPLSFVAAGGFATYTADGDLTGDPAHVNFKLDATQGAIGLFDASLNLIDLILYGPQRTDVSQGRSPDASDTLVYFPQPTPDVGNPGNALSGPGVVLNEVLARNATLTNADGSITDWVELYNAGTNAVDLFDTSLSDDLSNPRRWVFPTNSPIGAGGRLVIRFDGNAPASATNTGFGLSATGSGLYWFDPPALGGGLRDAVTFGLQIPDYSIGRIPDGSGGWTLAIPTPAGPNVAAVVGSAGGLKVNEWMADPASGEDWFELYNSAPNPVALGGLVLTDNLNDPTESPVPALSFIGVGSAGFLQFTADGAPSLGADHANFKLAKSGESIGIFTSAGTLIDGVTFGSQQTGVSQGRLPDGAATIANFARSPSPAASNFLPATNAVVNEVLSHSDPPLEDAIELYNPAATSANIGGWFLSNSQDDFKKYRVPDGTTIPARGFKVFYEFQFNPTNGGSIPFTLNAAHGDQVYLSQADGLGNLTGYRATANFGAAAHGISFGRFTNSVAAVDYVGLSARSFGVDHPADLAQFRTGLGAANYYPLVGPVVINEIMFNPPPSNGVPDNITDEYLELLNVTPNPVPLFDPLAPTNTWKIAGGVAFQFPANVTLPGGGLLLLVNFDPVSDLVDLAEFRARYGLSTNVPLFGPYGGHLANSGESIALYRPDPPQLPPHPDAGYVPDVRVDQIDYLSAAPWPATANATGKSIQRLAPLRYGNEPTNWVAAAPTAGAVNSAVVADVNADGLPDIWQLQYFASIYDPNAAPGADPDHDGLSNSQEYLAGTDPTDFASRLTLEHLQIQGAAVHLQFAAVAGHSYTIQVRTNLAAASWSGLTNLPPVAQSAEIMITDPVPLDAGVRFYRLITPALP